MKKIKLSASKIKTLETCSWIYFCQYVLKIPQTTNLGASRGLCAHVVLECFVNPRHKKHYDLACEKSKASKPVLRLIHKHAKKLNITNQEDIDMVVEMVCVAAKYDFFDKSAEKTIAEQEFKIESEHYIINGFIDKMSHLINNKIKITDYKTSKAKFSSEEIEGNLQGLMYSLACFKENKIIPEVEFLFLRFPRNPVQFFKKCTEAQLKGFELYLESIAKYLLKFDEKKATNNMAANSDKRWLCGKPGLKLNGQPNFICQYRNPCEYYVIKKEGEVIKSSFKNDLIATKGEKVEKMSYKGCPAFLNKYPRKADPFDFV